MIRTFVSFLCILIYFTSICQGAKVDYLDSLKTELTSSGMDTNRVNLLIDLSRYQMRSYPEEALRYGTEAKILSEKLKFKKGEALALKYIGLSYYFQAEYLETIHNWQSALDIFNSIGDTKGAANMLSNIGAIYFNQGDDTKAIEYYLKTLSIAEEIGDSLRIATVLNNIGGVYFNKEATRDKSLQYYVRALNVCKQIHYEEGIGTSAVNIGGYFLDKKNPDSALYYFNQSLDLLKNTPAGNVSYTLNSMGEAYALKGDYEKAKQFHYDALEIAKENKNTLDMTIVLIALGNTCKKQGNYKTAIAHYKEAEILARGIGVDYQLEEAYRSLATSFATIYNFEQAYHYQKLYSEIKDTLYNAENDKKIQRLQFNYDLESKQKEVDILTKDKKLKELEVKRERAVKNIFLLGLLSILIIAFILYRNMRRKIKVNRILDRQKAEIEKLLLNILPKKVADELQATGEATPRQYESVSVLFTDFVGFSEIAKGLTPSVLVAELNEFFVAFDKIAERFSLEKIKTIGDAYMCAGGIPVENNTHPKDVVRAGLEMQKFMNHNNEIRKKMGKDPWFLRVGIHTGPIVAGVVGEKKYAYDIWGSTVNISSRMESNGEPGKINVSSDTYELIKDDFTCQYRGKVYAKNIGDIEMYFVEDRHGN